MCDKAWKTPSFKSELKQYNCKSCPDAIVLGEILNAFITIFRAQTRSLNNDPVIHQARDLKQALHIIYQYGLVNPIFVPDEYSTVELPTDIINSTSGQADYNFSNQQYDAIQQAILHQYGYEYDLNQLAFWLITLIRLLIILSPTFFEEPVLRGSHIKTGYFIRICEQR